MNGNEAITGTALEAFTRWQCCLARPAEMSDSHCVDWQHLYGISCCSAVRKGHIVSPPFGDSGTFPKVSCLLSCMYLLHYK